MKSHWYVTKTERNISDFWNTVAMEIMWYAYHVYWMAGSLHAVYVNAKQFSSWRADIIMPCFKMALLDCHVIWILAAGVSCFHFPWLLVSSHGFDWISCCCLTFTLKFPSRASFGGQGRRVTGSRRLDLDSGIILWEDIEWSKWRQKAGMLQIALFFISVPSDGRFSRFIQRLFFSFLLKISYHFSLGVSSFPG